MGQDLSSLMADAARALQERPSSTATMASAVALAVRDVEGCDAASLTIVHRRGKVATPVATDPSARHADLIQYETGEGPCLDAIWESDLVDVPDVTREPRWPDWSRRMGEESGFRGMLVRRLYTARDTIGALNLYSRRARAFSAEDHELAAGFAAQVAVAISDSREIEQLVTALDGRTVIGQAQGIVMERYDLDAGAAFALLTRLSSHTNRKLREIAEDVVGRRDLPES